MPPEDTVQIDNAVVSDSSAYLLSAGTIFLWTLGVIIAKAVRDDIPLIGLSFMRWSVAVLFMLPFVWKELGRNIDVIRNNARLLTFQGVLLVSSSTMLFYSVNYTTAINATLVNAAQPMATGIIAWLILRESLNRLQIIGVALAAVGVVLMITKASWSVLITLDFNAGDLILVLAVIGYGWYSTNLRKLPHTLSKLAQLTIMLTMGCLLMSPVFIAESILVGPFPLNMESVTAVVSIALLVSIVAMSMWTKANLLIGPSRAAVFVCLMPLYGAIMATLFLGESLQVYHVLGAGFVCCGIFLVVHRSRRARDD
ncbi:DMT family transporter [Kineobactrum salinum]|uniref:DMT family transporter n=1 Tax=Kineobactrum salinum TaxID=2708301 RepID=A0A6C0TYS5_9GAMM|nr:DMT family transporter [Kineobactrum salinum]QIB64980.1 DMT family transporter [Kineobactrum salinum]